MWTPILVTLSILCNSQELEVQKLDYIALPNGTYQCAYAIASDILYYIESWGGPINTVPLGYQPIHTINISSPNPQWISFNVSVPKSQDITHCYIQSSVQIDSKLYITDPLVHSFWTQKEFEKIMFIFDLSSKQFVNISTYSYEGNLPISFRSGFCVTHYDQLLYVLGGDDRNTTQLYDIVNDQWTVLSQFKISRVYAGCALDVSGENIYLFGGRGDNDDPYKRGYTNHSIERYSVRDDIWYYMNEIFYPFFWFPSCKLFPLDGMIHCLIEDYNTLYIHIFDPVNHSLIVVWENGDADYKWHYNLILRTEECMMIIGQPLIFFYGNCLITPQPTKNPSSKPTFEPTVNPTNMTQEKVYINSQNDSYWSYIIIGITCTIVVIIAIYFIWKYMSAYVINKALVLIIAIAEFDDDKKALPGVRNCVENLINLWQNVYKYDVNICNNTTLYCTQSDVFSFLDEQINKLKDSNSPNAVIVHILSHGSSDDSMLASDMKKISTAFIQNKLTLETEANEDPIIKLIFQHSCRGEAVYHVDLSNINARKNQYESRCCCNLSRSKSVASRLPQRSPNEVNEEKVELQEHRSRATSSNSNNNNEISIKPQSNCVTVYGTIKDRTMSDGGYFTNCICEAFGNNANKCVKKDFNSLLVQIGRALQESTNNAEISNIDSSLRHEVVRFHPNKLLAL